MTDTSKEVVERLEPRFGSDSVGRYFAYMRTAPFGAYVRASDYDALLARVDALTKDLTGAWLDAKREHDLANEVMSERDRIRARVEEVEAERDAARAASGAVAVEIAERAAGIALSRNKPGMASEILALRPFSPDAAAALAEHDRKVRNAALDEAAEVCQQHREVRDPIYPESTIVVDLHDGPDACAAAILARKEGEL